MPDINPPGSQEWLDFIRKAEALDCEDGEEKIARLEAALYALPHNTHSLCRLGCRNWCGKSQCWPPISNERRQLLAELDRLKAATRHSMFRDHNCWKCRDGAKPCAQGNPRQCEHPIARNH